MITNFFDKAMNAKGLKLFAASNERFFAMDSSFETVFKFDLFCSSSDFTCYVLAKDSDGELTQEHSVNIAWTDGPAIREFMEYVQGMRVTSA